MAVALVAALRTQVTRRALDAILDGARREGPARGPPLSNDHGRHTGHVWRGHRGAALAAQAEVPEVVAERLLVDRSADDSRLALRAALGGVVAPARRRDVEVRAAVRVHGLAAAL